MQTLRSQLRELVAAREDRFHAIMVALIRDAPATTTRMPDDAEIRQMTNGFLGVLNEALEGTSRETRTFYIETLIPGLIAQGYAIELLMGPVASFAIATTADLIAHVPDTFHDEAIVWFSRFWGDYIQEVLHAGLASTVR